MELTREIRLLKYDGESSSEAADIVVREYPLTIFLNGEKLVTLLCSPEALDFLVYGFLISENIIKDKKEITAINVNEEKGIANVFTTQQKNNITGSCSPAKEGLKIEAKKLIALMKEFSTASEVFQSTGGVHSAALSDGKDILIYHEDVGRHNALDKVLGEAFVNNVLFTDKLILTSGRISSEILTKAVKRGIPMVVSRSAPMDLALQIGEEMNTTIVGFVRGNRMNVYTGGSRILFDKP